VKLRCSPNANDLPSAGSGGSHKKTAEALVVMANDFSDRADEIDPSLGSDGRTAIEDTRSGRVRRQSGG
jgi:hypothetical protein